MTLAERFARSQGWTKCEGVKGVCSFNGECDRWIDPETKRHAELPTIDVSILPIIWADCKAKGWEWLQNAGWASIWTGEGHYHSDEETTDPIEALCEAYCKAVEATNG